MGPRSQSLLVFFLKAAVRALLGRHLKAFRLFSQGLRLVAATGGEFESLPIVPRRSQPFSKLCQDSRRRSGLVYSQVFAVASGSRRRLDEHDKTQDEHRSPQSDCKPGQSNPLDQHAALRIRRVVKHLNLFPLQKAVLFLLSL